MRQFTVKTLCIFTLIGSLLLLLGILVTEMLTKRAVEQVALKQQVRYDSNLLADELRQSSDDLTRLARTFVVTADPRYEQQYNDILDIRNGRKPRPEDYHRIYWDFVAASGEKPRPDGVTIALQDLMKKAGFTEEEFAKLRQAQANSDALVRTEVVAMNAAKGKFDDGKGGFSVEDKPDLKMARDLMHSAEYHKYKADIMKPVDEFYVLLEKRTAGAILAAEQRAANYHLALLVVIGATIAFIGGMLLLLIKRVLAPLQHLERTLTRSVREQDLTLRVDASGRDEFNNVALSVNALLVGLEKPMREFKTQVDNVTSAVGRLSKGAATIVEGGRTQNEAASSTAAAVQELAVSIAHVASNADGASKCAARATQSATHGEAVAKEAASDIVSIASEVGTSSVAARSLSKRSNDIAGIVSVIKGVAEQTNLLALNAAIEAARAGEHGRGFAVVADEVRKLAERSARSAAEITELIDLVNGDTREVLINMEKSSSQVRSGAELAEQAARSLTEIRAGAEETRTAIQEIAVAAQQQSSASDDIARHVERIVEMTQANNAAANEAATLVNAIERVTQSLHDQIAGFKTH